ncbi:MAG: hypothetical protein ACTSWR_06035 [Candidatus Helarchaeota archaeon]
MRTLYHTVKKFILNFFGACIIGTGYNYIIIYPILKILNNLLYNYIKIGIYWIFVLIGASILAIGKEYYYEKIFNLHPDKSDAIALFLGFLSINTFIGFIVKFYTILS